VIISKSISYEYIVYYSKFIPSKIKEGRSSLNANSNNITLSHPQLSEERSPTNSKNNLDLKCIIVLEDLSLHYDSVLQEDQYILLGFDVHNHQYEEDNLEIKYIRDTIAQIHGKLKYSEGGLVYQVTQRLQNILYKTLKYALCYVAELCNIGSGASVTEKLRALQKNYYEPAFQDYIAIILKDPAFAQEVTSLAYKAMITVGLFPAYVELNTMDEFGLWLKIKNLLTNLVNAPYGSSHHASFSLGNLRYSFVFEPRNKEKQRVSITSEIKRGFSLKTHHFEYFRVKFFDFFPMDSWVQGVADRAKGLLHLYFQKVLDMEDTLDMECSLKEYLRFFVEEQEELSTAPCITNRLAKEFYERYRNELDENCNGKLFKVMTRLISDADVRGYGNLSNNCQTVVSEIIAVFSTHLQRFVEPVFDISKIPYMEDISPEDLVKDFLKFGSRFNNKFSHVAPFPLTHRLSYFDTFSDKDSCEMFFPKNFENIHQHGKKYLQREDVKTFLCRMEENRYHMGEYTLVVLLIEAQKRL
ncbi:Hypothetical predicted protein, partial [Olea europaea subsp. europaea]